MIWLERGKLYDKIYCSSNLKIVFLNTERMIYIDWKEHNGAAGIQYPVAVRILFDLPPGKEPKDKYVFGIYKEKGALIGVIDIVKDYKVPGEWIIGLLMIDQKERAKRLGRTLHDLIKTWVSQEHGVALRIGVVEENKGAYKFWEKMGYAELDRVKKNYGNKDQTVIIMNLSLDK